MHDIRFIREAPEAFDRALMRRGLAPMSSGILALDAGRRAKILAAETAQADQNKASKEQADQNKASKDVGAAKARGDDAEFERLRALVAEKKAEIAQLQAEAAAEDDQVRDLLMTIPNMPLDEVPDGADEDAKRTKTPTSKSAAGARRATWTLHRRSISTSPPWPGCWISPAPRSCRAAGLSC